MFVLVPTFSLLYYFSFSRIEQAYIPELGLSNKAQEFMSKQEQTEQVKRVFPISK